MGKTTIHTADGSIEKDGAQRILRFERRLDRPVARVWAALTQPSELIGWLAQAELDLKPGGAITLRWQNTDEEGNQAVAEGRITELDPPRLIEYATEPHGVLRWELRPDGDATLLNFTCTVTASDDDLRRAAAGWHIHLEHLEAALAGEPVNWETWMQDYYERWQRLEARYAATL